MSDPAGHGTYRDGVERSSWPRTLLVALGLSNLTSYWMAGPLVSPLHLTLYHWSGSAWALFAPVWLNLLAFWLAAAVLLASTWWSKLWRRMVWVGILPALPAIAILSFELGMSNRELTLRVATPHQYHLLHVWLFVITPVLWIALMAFWRPWFNDYFERVVHFSQVVLMFSGMAGAALFAQLAWFNWKAVGLNNPRPLHVKTTQVVKPRIVCLVLDELSYQQLYERRFPGLALPEFDRLATESTVFTQAIAAGFDTDRIMPALIAGRPVQNIRSTADGQLLTREQSASDWRFYDQHDTVFQDALAKGYSTGVSGWWNPYCRVLPAVLDHCYWADWYLERRGLAENAKPAQKMKSTLVRSLFELGKVMPNRVNGWIAKFGANDPMQAVDIYRDIAQRGDDMLKDPSATFVLVHVPIPHPVGIYNRATGQFSAEPTSYVDNLALCDIYLGHVRSELEERGEWDSTTLVIMGDHGWRTNIWKSASGWTETDEVASDGGKFDTRPAYIVKLPNQREGTHLNQPFHALQTRALLDAMMNGQIKTEPDLEAWVRAHP